MVAKIKTIRKKSVKRVRVLPADMIRYTAPKAHHFKKGQSGPGRPPGTPNKVTTTLKEAILMAGAVAGRDLGSPEGQELVTYLKMIAEKYPKTFAGLLGKLIPYQVLGRVSMEHTTNRYESREEVLAELQRRGLNVNALFPATKALTFEKKDEEKS